MLLLLTKNHSKFTIRNVNTELGNWIDIKNVTSVAGFALRYAKYNLVTKEVIMYADATQPIENVHPALQYSEHVPSTRTDFLFCGMAKWNPDVAINDWFPVACQINTVGQVIVYYPLHFVAYKHQLHIHYIAD